MKSLDEVIQEFERQEAFVEYYMQYGTQCRSDALHYLKEYRTTQTAYIKAIADLEDNPPLTWDELKQMKGKPVWVDFPWSPGGEWMLVYEIIDDEIANLHRANGRRYHHAERKTMGELWQAYRKERG